MKSVDFLTNCSSKEIQVLTKDWFPDPLYPEWLGSGHYKDNMERTGLQVNQSYSIDSDGDIVDSLANDEVSSFFQIHSFRSVLNKAQ
jgi:hypothetical protein